MGKSRDDIDFLLGINMLTEEFTDGIELQSNLRAKRTSAGAGVTKTCASHLVSSTNAQPIFHADDSILPPRLQKCTVEKPTDQYPPLLTTPEHS
jgi:hypothetical protein